MLRALLAALATLALAAAVNTALGALQQPGRADVIVVLGSAVHHGRPSPRLAARLAHGVALWRAGFAPVIIVSGGIEADGADEAAAMRADLRARGVPARAIVYDPSGRTTWETARFVARWLAAHHQRSVLAVSQDFHLNRCRLALHRFGVPRIFTSGPRYFEWRDLVGAPRDVIGLVEYALRRSPAEGG